MRLIRPRQTEGMAMYDRLVVVAVASWCLLVVLSLVGNLAMSRRQARQTALWVAEAYANKDLAFRLWGARHGGVYVPVSEATPPNPYLAHIPERDVTTSAGKELTLMNPAYMLRQAMATFAEVSGVDGRLTSLRPLNPVNAPDPWEEEGLRRMEGGKVARVHAFIEEDGRPYLRYMRAIITEKPCLKCHAIQGYHVGDVRGGMSFRLPMAPYLLLEHRTDTIIVLTHLVIWVVGLLGIAAASSRIRSQVRRRREMEEEIRQRHEFTRSIIESLTQPFYVFDASTHEILMANEAALQGRDPASLTCYSLAHQRATPCDGRKHPCPLDLVRRDKRAVTVEHVHYTAAGEPRYVEVQCYPIIGRDGEVEKVIEYVLDISERKKAAEARAKLQLQLQQAQKLEAIGLLAGGIAHDFNNLLTTIIGYSALVLQQLGQEEDDPVRASMIAVHEAGQRAASLTRQLLAFSRKQVMELRPLDLNALIRDIGKLLERLLGEDVALCFHLEEGPAVIKADESQIEQVLMNLAVNARDAMPEGGELVFETRRVEVDREFLRSHAGLEEGAYVRLCVSDTGTGMPPEVMEHIFDPFFTTKEKDRGTGLGLATVYGIVQQHGGHVFVSSEPGRGTTFKLYFPALPGEDADAAAAGDTLPAPPPPTGSETILVVDDEPQILRLVRDTLAPLGYRVVTAASGRSALARLERESLAVDLLLTDVIMQDMNGRQLADRVRQLQPAVRVLFMSGYADNLITAKGVLREEGAYFLHKPIVPLSLARKVREVLG